MKLPKLSKKDVLAIAITVIFIVLLSIPNYIDKSNCEVARPNYKCETIMNVIKENCNYLQTNNFADESITWYVQQLCPLENQYHNSKLVCITAQEVCMSVV